MVASLFDLSLLDGLPLEVLAQYGGYGRGYGGGYGFNPLFLLFAIPGMALAGIASWLVKSRARAMAVPNLAKLTGAEVAKRILEANGITGVKIEKVGGHLTDYYHPAQKRLALSDATYDKQTITAMAVAAHEVGHAIQDKTGYPALFLRQTIAPVARWGQRGAGMLLMAGFLLSRIGIPYVVEVACLLFFLFVLFQLITLPVEFNASSRALSELARLQLSGGEEWSKTKKVLNAAALTYVAATLAAVMSFLYLLYVSQSRRR